MLKLDKERLSLNELMMPQKKKTHTFFIAVNKTETIASNYSTDDLQSLSIRRGDSHWFVSPRVPVSANISLFLRIFR